MIDADRLNEVLNINFGHTGGADVLRQLIDIQPTVQAVPIPDNATNGDVIMAIFPNDMWKATEQDKDWWNAPYEGSDKE